MATLGLKARIFTGEEREVEERLNEFLSDPAVAVEDVRLGYQARYEVGLDRVERRDAVAVLVLYRTLRALAAEPQDERYAISAMP